MAKQLGLEYRDDEHAAELLEARGVDFVSDQKSILDLAGAEKPDQAALTRNDAERLHQVYAIQRDLVRRRRRRLRLLLARLFAFVALPTIIAGYYYYAVATPMYETRSEFVIQKSEAQNALGLGSLFSGTGFANSADSITVQGYLTSREAMKKLDADLGFRAHFQQQDIDSVQRLADDSSMEAAYALYQKNVKVGFDPTEGVIKMQVVAADPATSAEFSRALIRYAEERVDAISLRVRSDQMQGASDSFEKAEEDMLAAQMHVLDLQQKRGVLSAEAEITSQMSIINSLELQVEEKRLNLAEIEANPAPNQTRAGVLRDEIVRVQDRVQELRDQLTSSSANSISLAAISGELQLAEADLRTRQLMMQQALQQLETARIEANRQVRYLSLGVAPVAPDIATYPRKLENTALAFMIFLGIYLMLSLTVSILREQVSV